MKLNKVYIEWVDSFTMMGWTSVNELDLKSKIITEGYLVKETKDWIAVSSTYDTENNTFADVLAIPKFAIIKMEKSK